MDTIAHLCRRKGDCVHLCKWYSSTVGKRTTLKVIPSSDSCLPFDFEIRSLKFLSSSRALQVTWYRHVSFYIADLLLVLLLVCGSTLLLRQCLASIWTTAFRLISGTMQLKKCLIAFKRELYNLNVWISENNLTEVLQTTSPRKNIMPFLKSMNLCCISFPGAVSADGIRRYFCHLQNYVKQLLFR